ncbi:MAG: type II toxin-antitoxin system VapC family toxin [Candidatus Eremiobacteraeota bacterium]|nr:type II toxin-antitoxin system VapC family toxin [Candidatus Eremiobacteraeota bacterium]
MVAANRLVFIDSNVFFIDLRYRRDRLFPVNRAFLDLVRDNRCGVTSIINILEVCGVLSFNLNPQQLRELFHYLPDKYHLQIIPQAASEHILPRLPLERVLKHIEKKMSFGDALAASIAEDFFPGITSFVTWDAEHFRDKIANRVLTPEEYIQDR